MHNLSIFHISSGQKRKQTFAFSNSLFLDESELANKKISYWLQTFQPRFLFIPEPPQSILFLVQQLISQRNKNNEITRHHTNRDIYSLLLFLCLKVWFSLWSKGKRQWEGGTLIFIRRRRIAHSGLGMKFTNCSRLHRYFQEYFSRQFWLKLIICWRFPLRKYYLHSRSWQSLHICN